MGLELVMLTTKIVSKIFRCRIPTGRGWSGREVHIHNYIILKEQKTNDQVILKTIMRHNLKVPKNNYIQNKKKINLIFSPNVYDKYVVTYHFNASPYELCLRVCCTSGFVLKYILLITLFVFNFLFFISINKI